MNIVQKLVNLFTAAAPTSLDMSDDHWQHVNPRWSMVVRVFVNRLENHCVLPRLETSANVDDLGPVGALPRTHYAFAARPWELK